MQVILNADDFGRSAEINAAVLRAHREGILTSASLMVAGEAAGEAVVLARKMPSLAVGLHVVLTDGRPKSPTWKIPHLVNAEGFFPRDPFKSGLRYFFSSAVQKELALELKAQFEAFAATGLPLSHVDGHLDMHMHPTVFKLLLPLAERYGANGIRLPRDDIWLSLSHEQRLAATKMTWALVFGLLSHWGLKHLHRRRLVFTDRVYGLMQTSRMDEAYVLKVLRYMQNGTAELYFHPSTIQENKRFGSNPGDLLSLLSPAVKKVMMERGIRPATYFTIQEQ
jgi:hopanoid biosynthesis associated protein HpnK